MTNLIRVVLILLGLLMMYAGIHLHHYSMKLVVKEVLEQKQFCNCNH